MELTKKNIRDSVNGLLLSMAMAAMSGTLLALAIVERDLFGVVCLGLAFAISVVLGHYYRKRGESLLNQLQISKE